MIIIIIIKIMHILLRKFRVSLHGAYARGMTMAVCMIDKLWIYSTDNYKNYKDQTTAIRDIIDTHYIWS